MQITIESSLVTRDSDGPPANALLIAAAPELLAALESFLTWRQQLRSIGRSLPGLEAREREARAAILRAKGKEDGQ